MAFFVAFRKIGCVVLVLVEKSKRYKSPIDTKASLRTYLLDPTRRDPCERTNRIPEELDIEPL